MKIPYFRSEICLLVVLATITRVRSLSRGAYIDLEQRAHVLRFTLLSCDGACLCKHACVYTHYDSGQLNCQLTQPNQTGRTLYFDGTLGFLNTENDLDAVFKRRNEECSPLDPPFCPDLVTSDTAVVLSNLNTTGNSQRIRLTGPDGANTVSCPASGECSDFDDRKLGTAMKEPCGLDSDCADEASECRDGQCWCKPGLSHDPDTQSCVTLFPGQYGTTFQFVKQYRIDWYYNKIEGFYNGDKDDILEIFIDVCLLYSKAEVMCRYGDVSILGQCTWGLSNMSDVERWGYAPHIRKVDNKVKYIYIQRDCESGVQ